MYRRDSHGEAFLMLKSDAEEVHSWEGRSSVTEEGVVHAVCVFKVS